MAPKTSPKWSPNEKIRGLGAQSKKLLEKVSFLRRFWALECGQSVVNSSKIVDFGLLLTVSKMTLNGLPKWSQNEPKTT